MQAESPRGPCSCVEPAYGFLSTADMDVQSPWMHCHGLRLVKNIEGGNQNIGGKVSIIDEIIGVSELLGHVPEPPVYAYVHCLVVFQWQFNLFEVHVLS